MLLFVIKDKLVEVFPYSINKASIVKYIFKIHIF